MAPIACLHPRLGQQVAQPRHVGEPLPQQLIGEAARAVLVARLRLPRLDRAGVPLRAGALVAGGLAHLHPLSVVLAVPELRRRSRPVRPRTPGGSAPRRLVVAQGLAHHRRRLEGAQVERAAHGVGAEELDVVGVVLLPLHHPVPVGVPGAGLPGPLERPLRLGPQRAQPLRVPGELPLAVQLEHAAHLPVRRRLVVPQLAGDDRQQGAEAHPARRGACSPGSRSRAWSAPGPGRGAPAPARSSRRGCSPSDSSRRCRCSPRRRGRPRPPCAGRWWCG